MSNNINTNTPSPAHTQVADGKSTGGATSSPVGFQTGNAGNTMAILKLIEDLMKLYNYKNDAFVKQATAESQMANAFSDSQVKLGDQEMTEAEITGAFSAASGLLNMGLGATGFMEERGLGPMEDDLNGSQKFVDNLSNREAPEETLEDTHSQTEEMEMEVLNTGEAREPGPERNQANTEKANARLEEMISELKSGEYKMSDGKGNAAEFKPRATEDDLSDQEVVQLLDEPQLGRLKDATNEQITTKKSALDAKRNQLRLNFDKRQVWSTATSGVSQGASSIGSGVMKKQQAETKAENTQYQTAQQQFQSLTRETESQGEKDLQSAESLIQMIPDIDKSNNAILSA